MLQYHVGQLFDIGDVRNFTVKEVLPSIFPSVQLLIATRIVEWQKGTHIQYTFCIYADEERGFYDCTYLSSLDRHLENVAHGTAAE